MIVGHWRMRPIIVGKLLFADDILIITDTEEILQKTITIYCR